MGDVQTSAAASAYYLACWRFDGARPRPRGSGRDTL